MVKEIRAAKFYSIMADEVTSHNKEELALCARFADNSNKVREEFLTFLHLPDRYIIYLKITSQPKG